jgi:FixJ family two-component response regulator
MTMPGFTISVVDDDAGVLKALSKLLRINGLSIQTFSSPGQFLLRHDPSVPGCVILDLAMPELDGLKLQQELTTRHADFPVIFLTGKGDIPTGIQAMKAGAVDFLTKPVKNSALLAAIEQAREQVAKTTESRALLESIKARLAKLSPREHQVLERVVEGRLNKQIAGELGTSVKTIKVHRGRMMKKMGVRTVADLVRMAERADIRPRNWSALECGIAPRANSTASIFS